MSFFFRIVIFLFFRMEEEKKSRDGRLMEWDEAQKFKDYIFSSSFPFAFAFHFNNTFLTKYQQQHKEWKNFSPIYRAERLVSGRFFLAFYSNPFKKKRVGIGKGKGRIRIRGKEKKKRPRFVKREMGEHQQVNRVLCSLWRGETTFQLCIHAHHLCVCVR